MNKRDPRYWLEQPTTELDVLVSKVSEDTKNARDFSAFYELGIVQEVLQDFALRIREKVSAALLIRADVLTHPKLVKLEPLFSVHRMNAELRLVDVLIEPPFQAWREGWTRERSLDETKVKHVLRDGLREIARVQYLGKNNATQVHQ